MPIDTKGKTPRQMREEAHGIGRRVQLLQSDLGKLPEDDAAGRERLAEEIHARSAEGNQWLQAAEQAEAEERRRNDTDAFLKRLDRKREPEPDPPGDMGNLPHHQTKQRYSLLKALREMSEGGIGAVTGLEKEVSQAIKERQAPERRKSGHLSIPWDLSIGARRDPIPKEFRNLDVTTGAGAVYETVSNSMIELLQNLMLTRRLGVRVMTGLNGNLSLPKKTGRGTAYWVTPGNAPTGSNPTIGAIDLAPNTVGMVEKYDRRFLMQTSVDAEMFLREDISEVMALELDRVVFNGSGLGAEPRGIITYTGVNVVALGTDGGAITRAALLQAETEMEADNALLGNISWTTTPEVKGLLKDTEAGTAGFPIWIWGPDNTLVSYPAYATNQMPSDLTKGTGTDLHAAILGNWREAILAFWSGLDILVDPYTSGDSGTVRIVALQDADFELRHPEAFSVIRDINIAA